MEVTVLSEVGIITGLCIQRDSIGRTTKVLFGPTVFESKDSSIFRVAD